MAGDDDLDLETLWEASPSGPPSGVPAELWRAVSSGQALTGIFRDHDRSLVVVCALAQPRIGRLSRGDVAIQRETPDAEGYPRILLTFIPSPARRDQEALLVRPLGVQFLLVDAGQRRLWEELMTQGTTLVSYIDIAEGVTLAQRRLRLAPVAAGVRAAIAEADQLAIREALPRPPTRSRSQ